MQIGAAQIAFINPPSLTLDYTDAADIADFSLLKTTVQDIVLSQISALAVLPNRYLLKLDAQTDYFSLHQPYLGVLRLTIDSASGFQVPKKSGISGLINKIVKDVPDCYTHVKFGATEWKTSVKKDTLEPEWRETHDFLVTSDEQVLFLSVKDDDVRDDDVLGTANISIKQLLANPTSTFRLSSPDDDGESPLLNIASSFHPLTTDLTSLSNPSMDQLSLSDSSQFLQGLLTILVSHAIDLPNPSQKPFSAIKPSVSITFLGKKYETAQQIYTTGYDILNPSFDVSFEVPMTKELMERGLEGLRSENFEIRLLDGGAEVGNGAVGFESVVSAEGGFYKEEVNVGGAKIGVGFVLRAVEGSGR